MNQITQSAQELADDLSEAVTRALVEQGHPPHTANDMLNVSVVLHAYAGTWVATLVQAAYEAGYGDGITDALDPDSD